VALELSATAHATDTTAGNIGVEIKSGDNTRSLVGLTYMDASNHFIDITTLSWFNRRLKAYYPGTSSSSGVGTLSQIPFCTWVDEAVIISAVYTCNNSTVNAINTAAIYIDSTGYTPTLRQDTITAGGGLSITPSCMANGLAEGYHQTSVFTTTNGSVTSYSVNNYVGVRG
jgi:hypothetical protein